MEDRYRRAGISGKERGPRRGVDGVCVRAPLGHAHL